MKAHSRFCGLYLFGSHIEQRATNDQGVLISQGPSVGRIRKAMTKFDVDHPELMYECSEDLLSWKLDDVSGGITLYMTEWAQCADLKDNFLFHEHRLMEQ